MIAGVLGLLYGGRQPGVVALVFVCQGLIYRELVSIAIVASKEAQMPGFSVFYGYWFAVCAYYMYAKTLQVHVVAALSSTASSTLASSATPLMDDDDCTFLEASTEGGLNATVASLSRAAAATAGSLGDGVASYFLSEAARLIGLPVAGAPAAQGAGGGGSGPLPVPPLPLLVTAPLRLVALAITQYVPIAFGLYLLGFMAFVISLRQRRNFRYQFSQFAYCHMALAVVVVQSTFLLANAYRGLIWFLLPCGLVVVNDSFAYIFGFFFGRTPLIKRLSPKKTWEGWFGGAAVSFLFAFAAMGALQTLPGASPLKQALLCPVERGLGFNTPTCDPDAVFDGLYVPHPLATFAGMGWTAHPLHQMQQGAALPLWQWLAALAGGLYMSRMQLHGLALAAFASAVAPFGGFFASGFKRAFKIKDFGSSIPGHGGFTDRMDCQIVMGAFSHVYAHYLLRLGMGYHGGESDVASMFTRIVVAVSPSDLVRLYQMLSCFLSTMGYLTPDGNAQTAGEASAGAGLLHSASAASHRKALEALAHSAAKACVSSLQARAAEGSQAVAQLLLRL